LIIEATPKEAVSKLARTILFVEGEEDTAVYVYGQYDAVTERHHESDLVVHFETDSLVKIRAVWQGANVAIEGNFPTMGWDHEDGEFGLGGNWWRKS
jgi:hypothetical protein